jgi:hypothetical protein
MKFCFDSQDEELLHAKLLPSLRLPKLLALRRCLSQPQAHFFSFIALSDKKHVVQTAGASGCPPTQCNCLHALKHCTFMQRFTSQVVVDNFPVFLAWTVALIQS